MASTVYGDGPFEVKFVSVWRWPWPFGRNCPPCPLIVAVPTAAGDYPVVVLQHGYMLKNDFYTELMQHVASHGYVVVAPRMYSCCACPSATAEIERAVAVINWLPDNLAASFPDDLSVARPDLQRIVLSGHSRGAKVAFGVALGKACCKLMTQLSALAAFDPVDGVDDKHQTPPPIVNSTSRSFQLGLPTLIVGTELGSQKACPFCLACAPENFNHKGFYRCSSPPTYHFVAAEYGHMDFLNDDTKACSPIGWLSYWMCKSGSSRAPLRNFAGGILVAFLKATLFGDRCALNDALEHSPILLSTVESCPEECSAAVSGFSSV